MSGFKIVLEDSILIRKWRRITYMLFFFISWWIWCLLLHFKSTYFWLSSVRPERKWFRAYSTYSEVSGLKMYYKTAYLSGNEGEWHIWRRKLKCDKNKSVRPKRKCFRAYSTYWEVSGLKMYYKTAYSSGNEGEWHIWRRKLKCDKNENPNIRWDVLQGVHSY